MGEGAGGSEHPGLWLPAGGQPGASVRNRETEPHGDYRVAATGRGDSVIVKAAFPTDPGAWPAIPPGA
jgi:hypothetical protein